MHDKILQYGCIAYIFSMASQTIKVGGQGQFLVGANIFGCAPVFIR